jgi:hypothetical protein
MGSEFGPCPTCDGTGWLSDELDGSRSGEGAGELGEDGQVGV